MIQTGFPGYTGRMPRDYVEEGKVPVDLFRKVEFGKFSRMQGSDFRDQQRDRQPTGKIKQNVRLRQAALRVTISSHQSQTGSVRARESTGTGRCRP